MKERMFLHFNQDDNGGNGDNQDPPKEEPPKEPEGDDIPDGTPDWVKKRLSKLAKQKNDALQLLKDKEEQDEKNRLKKLEEEGELKQVNQALTEKLQRLEPIAKKYETLEQGIRDTALKGIADALGDDAAAAYAEFGTEELQTVAKTIINKQPTPTPSDERPGGRNVDVNEQAALKKYGSKANIARLDPVLYRKLWPNPRRRMG